MFSFAQRNNILFLNQDPEDLHLFLDPNLRQCYTALFHVSSVLFG
jgi:hypothetical protein